jgi:hypothetical protein
LEQWQAGKKLKFDLADLNLDRWLVDLKSDKAALAHIHNNALLVTPEKDAKLHELKTLITAKINQPINAAIKKSSFLPLLPILPAISITPLKPGTHRNSN